MSEARIESRRFDVTQSLVQEHIDNIQGLVPIIERKRDRLRRDLIDSSGNIDLLGIPNIHAYMGLGVFEEREIIDTTHRLLDETQQEEKTEPSSFRETSNQLYARVLDVAIYLRDKYEGESSEKVTNLLKKIDISSLSQNNLKKLDVFMSEYEGELSIFNDSDFDILYDEYSSDEKFAEYFDRSFLYNAALLGNQEKVLNFIKRTPDFRLNNYSSALNACARVGLAAEVFNLIETRGRYNLTDFNFSLRACVYNGFAEQALTLIEQEVAERPYTSRSFETSFSDCAGKNKELAQRVWNIIQQAPYDISEFSFTFDNLISQGYAKEIYSIITTNPVFASNPRTVELKFCIDFDPSLASAAWVWVNEQMRQGKIRRYSGLMESFAEHGFAKEVLESLGQNPNTDPAVIVTTLELCEEQGFGNEVRTYIDKYFPSPKDTSKTFIQEEKQEFIDRVQGLLKDVGVGPQTKLAKNLRVFIKSLSYQELQFFSRLAQHDGLFNPTVLSFINNTSDVRGAEMFKTGTSLALLNKELTGVFVRRIPEQPAQIWERLATETNNPIAVEPVLGLWNNADDTRTIVSRYCGLSFEALLKSFNLADNIDYFGGWLNLGFASEWRTFEIVHFLHGHRNEFLKDITEQALAIIDRLQEQKINHGHLHVGNFVVELIDEEYLQNYLQSKIAIMRDGMPEVPTINNIPYQEDKFTFDFLRYGELRPDGEKKWRPVVRLIDIDMASYITDEEVKSL